MDEESKKLLTGLCENVKAMQAEIEKLKTDRGATNSGSNSQAGSQNSDTVSGSDPPPTKRRKTGLEGASDDEDDEEEVIDLRRTSDGAEKLVQMSEEAAAFIETAFKSKLKNADRKSQAEKYGVPDSRWLKCPELDPVVGSTIPAAARRTDNGASRLQNYWLDAVNPLVYVLERAEELEIPSEVIGAIQTSLQLLGNASAHNTTARRKALLIQMNTRLKDLVRDPDFKDAAPMLFGEGFGTLAKERLEAATALSKTLGMDKPRQDFYKGHPQRNRGRGGGSHYNGGHYNKQRRWQPGSSKIGQKQSSKK